MKKIMLVFGTRPEAIKMCPLVKELESRKSCKIIVCVTGQHKEMLKQVLNCFSILPDYDLAIMKHEQTLFDVTNSVLTGMKVILEKEKPNIVLVHGDTSTTFATALACFYLKIPIGHVEAGLRTYEINSPYPEEFNRQAVGILADIHFAPTDVAKNNLIREGKKEKRIFVTGNTAIDALKLTVTSSYSHPVLDWAKGSRFILLTAHRRENQGEPFLHIFHAVRRLVQNYKNVKVVYPLHMNPQIRKSAEDILGKEERIKLIEPLEVVDFHNFIAHCDLILTDSGGIQEEAPALGKPVLVLRDTTERPEGIKAGTLKLIGTQEDRIYFETVQLLNDDKEYEKMSKAINPYGDGTASKKIVDILLKDTKI